LSHTSGTDEIIPHLFTFVNTFSKKTKSFLFRRIFSVFSEKYRIFLLCKFHKNTQTATSIFEKLLQYY